MKEVVAAKKFDDPRQWAYLHHDGRLFQVITAIKTVRNDGRAGRLWVADRVFQNYGLASRHRYVIVEEAVEPGLYDDDDGHVCEFEKCRQLVHDTRSRPFYEERAESWNLVRAAA